MAFATSKGRVLVVEDSPLTREQLAALVRQLGYEPIVVSGGAEALAVLERVAVDVVLLDIMMPGMSGLEVLEQLAVRGRIPELPVLVVSGLTEREERLAALEQGASDFLNKPVDPDELAARLRTVVRLKYLYDQLAVREANLRAIMEGVLDGIITIDDRGQIDEFNTGAERLFGYSRAEIVGQNVKLLMPSPSSEEHDCYLDRFQWTGERQIIGVAREMVGRRKNGSTFPMTLAVNEIKLPRTGRRLFAGVLHDISHRKHIEEQLLLAKENAESANRAKSDFLASMSHELRTPLNGILGMNELLLNTELTERQRQFVEAGSTSGKVLLQQINDILDLSKIEAGKLDMDIHECHLEALVYDIADVFSHNARQKGYPLHCHVDPKVCVTVLCDGNRLRQILVNLIGNALNFTTSGSVTVRAHSVQQHNRQSTVRFSVTDTGVGIPEDRRDRLFAPFSQVDSSTSRKYGGTGLGLSICRQLVELMGGQIGVESQPGVGSTFWFEVPLELAADDETMTQRKNLLNRQRVLAVDGIDRDRKHLADSLQAWECQFEQIATLPEALQAVALAEAAGVPFTVVLADCGLTVGDEYILLQQLAEHPCLPIIGLSADPDEQTVAYLRQLGIRHILRDPIRPSALFDAMVSVLSVDAARRPYEDEHGLILEKQRPPLTGHILVAEDNHINQMFVRELLKHCGCTCDIAVDGRQALAASRDNSYALILMDCQMPEMDGFTATREIRRREAQECSMYRVPIIALTANALKGDRELCLDAGMDDYLSKPLQARQLHAMLQRFLPIPTT